MTRGPASSTRRLLASASFWPSLAWERTCARLLGGRRWWDAIDDDLVLGGLPTAREVGALFALGVRGAVNTCAEHPGPLEEYRRLGMRHLHLPTIDYTPPLLEDVERALEFVAGVVALGDKVYVHCKAGRGRSATVAMCWLMQRHRLTPAEAQRWLRRRRPHVDRDLALRDVVVRFHRKVPS